MPIKKILIIDDESLARDRIRRFLNELNITVQIEEAADGLKALEKIILFQPEIVFLDIQMPGLNGFEVLQHVENRNFQLIFQTAYDEYAIKAFDENACDYLLKPFSKERFQKSISKVLNIEAQSEVLKRLELDVHQKMGYLDKIAVKQSGKLKIVELTSVDCFISQDHYTCIYSGGGELISDISLNWLEEHIDPNYFIRCHRNNIIAINQIHSVSGTNESVITLKNGMTVSLSRNNRKKILNLFKHSFKGI